MTEPLVQQGLDILYPDGIREVVRLKVWPPAAGPLDGGTCTVIAEGLRGWPWDKPVDIPGVGAFHALAQGLDFLYRMLAAEVSRGAVLHLEKYPNQAIPLDALFARLKGRKKRRMKPR
jgi:hypothetical protein